MNIFTKSAVVAVGVLTAWGAYADPITGSITFTGGVTLDNNSDAGSSTKVMSWTGVNGLGRPVVQSDSGSFAAFGVAAGDTVSLVQPWKFNNTTLINNFWTVDGFVFDLDSSQIVTETPGVGVTVSGTGTISGPAGSGLDATAGIWTFSAFDPSTALTDDRTPVFSFQGITTIPDGSSTLILLGASLSGLGLIRRKLVK